MPAGNDPLPDPLPSDSCPKGDPGERENRLSVLFPGKAVDTPTVAGVAVVGLVELALEAVQDVHHAVEARALQRLASLDGPVAAAADEHHRPFHEIGAGELLHLPDEMRVELPLGAVVPGDHHRAQRVPYEHVLHLAAAVDEQRVRVLLEELVGFPGFQMVHGRNYRRRRIRAMNAPDTPFAFDAAIAAAADRIEPKVVAWRRDFHQNPELGNRELRTGGIVAANLRALGF